MHLYGPKQLADSIRTVRKNTILIAEDIPEEQYGYRPTADSRSVAENLIHIAMVPRLDRILHEEEHVATLEGFDFGKLLKRSEGRRRSRTRRPSLSNYSGRRVKIGRNGSKAFPNKSWPNRCASLAEVQKPALR